MYKNEEIKGHNQRFGEKTEKFQGKRRVHKNEREPDFSEKNRTSPDQTLQRKDFVPYDIGTIPSLNIKLAAVHDDYMGFDLMLAKHEMDYMTFLKIAEKIIPSALFEEPEDMNEFVFEVLNRIEQTEGIHIGKIRKDGISIYKTGYEFNGYYVFDMNWFYDRMPDKIKKVIFPVIHSILNYLGTDLNDIGIGYLESDFEDQKSMSEDEDNEWFDADHFNFLKEVYDEANEKYYKYEEIVSVYSLDIVNDIEWICEFMFYNGFEKWIPSLVTISDIIANIGIDAKLLNFNQSEDGIYNHDIHVFTFVREDHSDNYVFETLDNLFGESGTTDIKQFDVTLTSEPMEEPFNTVNACMLDRIFKEMNYIIHDNKI